jgi:hypothetical protein
MLKKKYDEITVEHGEKKGPNWYAYPDGSKRKKSDANATKTSGKIIEAINIKTGASNPASVKLMGDDDDSPLLQDQTEYMSK